MRQRVKATLVVALSLAAPGCGDLDDVTTVKDLRVLAVQAEPAGFLVPLGAPAGATPQDLQATLTALVVDPQGQGRTLTFTGVGCPDYLSTLQPLGGQASRVCLDSATTAALPPPLDTALAATPLGTPDMPGQAAPATAIEYHPRVSFGLTPAQLGLFFSPTATGDADVDATIAYDRDFGMDAIVDLTFQLGAEKARALKRLVYWPLLPPAEVPATFTQPQLPNQNPRLVDLQFFRHRDTTTGDLMDPYPDASPTLSLATVDQMKDRLYVLPVPAPDAAERYLLRARNTQTDVVETKDVARELLTYQFYATAGTFSPASRQSELSPALTSPDGRVHLDSEYLPPKAADLPADGRVTVWVVVRDERAGTSWDSRTLSISP